MKIDVYIYGDQMTPSSRLRWINYISEFKQINVDFKIKKIQEYVYKKFFFIKTIEKSDVIVIQKFILSKRILNKFKKKCNYLIFDIDDAIWLMHTSDFKKNIFNLRKFYYLIKKKFYNFLFYKNINLYDKIITSNNYLKNHLELKNNNISVIPTSPSDNTMTNNLKPIFKNKFIIGWIGTNDNLIFLKLIEKYIKKFIIENENVYLLIICDQPYKANDNILNNKIINIKWDINTKEQYIQNFDVGIMPLKKDNWCLGKAAYKLIYYMKFGIPTISTNWGFQQNFINNGINGYLVENNSEWEISLQTLYREPNTKKNVGKNGYNTFLKLFSKKVIFNKLKNELMNL